MFHRPGATVATVLLVIRNKGGSVGQGLTTVQAAEIAGGLHWASARLFEILGAWAGDAERSDIAVSLATASRHMGWHADDLAGLAPDSILVDDTTESPPPAAIVGALEAVRATSGSLEQLAIAHRVLLARLAARCVAVERMTAPHADAPLARVVGFLLTDLRRDRDEGEALLERLLVDVASVERVGAVVVDAERRLVEAGGLVPITITL